MLIEMIENNPFQDGVDAYHEGEGLEACLYVPFSEGEDRWIDGWRSEFNKALTESTMDDIVLDNDNMFYLRFGWLYEGEKKGKYQGNTVTLDSPTTGDVKRFKVYVDSGKKDSDGNVIAKKVNFGSEKGSKLRVKKNDPDARKSFAARHKCDTATDKTTPRYWSCRGATSNSNAKYW